MIHAKKINTMRIIAIIKETVLTLSWGVSINVNGSHDSPVFGSTHCDSNQLDMLLHGLSLGGGSLLKNQFIITGTSNAIKIIIRA